MFHSLKGSLYGKCKLGKKGVNICMCETGVDEKPVCYNKLRKVNDSLLLDKSNID